MSFSRQRNQIHHCRAQARSIDCYVILQRIVPLASERALVGAQAGGVAVGNELARRVFLEPVMFHDSLYSASHWGRKPDMKRAWIVVQDAATVVADKQHIALCG